MKAAQARRIAVLLRDYATSLPLWSQELRAECSILAAVMDREAGWKQIGEKPLPIDGGWTA